MQVVINGTLRDLLGTRSVDIPVDAPVPLRTLLREMVRQYPALADSLWTNDEKMTGYVKVMINGRALEHLRGASLEMSITPDDNLALFTRWASDVSWTRYL